MDIKQLKKLASACRKAGIKHFKSADFEFTLTDDIPAPRTSKKSTHTNSSTLASHPDIPSDMPTQEQLLFWSARTEEDTGKEEVSQ